jgi:hypothetical protein
MADRNTKINGNQIKDATITADELAASIAGGGLAGGAGTVLSVNTAGGLEVSGDNVQIADDGITGAKLAAAIAGSGLVQDGSGNLDINPGNALEISGDTIAVAADSIGTNELDETAAYSFSGAIESSNTPTTANHVANKAYVDSVAQGLDVKDSVRLITTSNITLSGEQTIDGFLTSTDRVLVNGQTTASENGIYDTAAGAWTRSSDMPAASSAASVFTFVEEGTINADNGFVCSNDVGNDTVGTHDLTFVQFSGAGSVIAGDGLAKSGNTLSVNVDDSSIEINADTLRVKALGIATSMLAADSVTAAKLNADTAGAGLGQAAGGELDVNVDDSSIEINADSLRVKALGITNAMLAGSIADTKLVEDYIKTSEVDDSTIEFGTSLNVKDLGITNAKLADSTIKEPKLDATNAPSDGQVLSYNLAGTNFTWVDAINADAIEETDVSREDFTPNGILVLFTLANAPVVNSVQVYLNGLLQEPNGGDYTLSGSGITFVVAPETGDLLQVHYLNT